MTGNGFGFAVVSATSGAVTHFYAHPYRFERADPKQPLGEGVEASDFIARAEWTVPGDTTVARGAAATRFVDETHVVAVSDGFGRQSYFMPFGLERNALVALHDPPGPGCLRVEWRRPPRSRETRAVDGKAATVLAFEGIRERLALVSIDDASPAASASGDCLSGGGWALLPLDTGESLETALKELAAWRGDVRAPVVEARELNDFETWRVPLPKAVRGEAERRLWRQSEAILRMAQSRELNRPGRWSRGWIVASVPGGDWFAIWARDMVYAAVALARMGHRMEAKRALEAFFDARPVGKMRDAVRGFPYQVSVVRYFGDGSEEPYFTMEGATNVELDDWGLVLWALGEYVEHFDDHAFLERRTYRGSIYDSAKTYVAKPLLGNLDPHGGGWIVAKDTSIWEERQKDAKHFAFSTAAAIRGLRAFESLARRRKDEAYADKLKAKIEGLERGFRAAFVADDGALRGTLEPGIKNEVDGAALAALSLGAGADPGTLRATIARLDALKVASGGYRRVRCILEDPTIFEYWYERQEFLFVNFSLAELLLRLGETARADGVVARMVEKAAADRFQVPEMYVSVDNPLFPGAIGDPAGAIPMVGYGAGAFVSYVLQRPVTAR
ncbi:MAG: glycoside hydrolase family 15 [Proteobacteria bacterium]|nr:glycoside hydrolase family 15 [Pseudomonadota bacterium]